MSGKDWYFTNIFIGWTNTIFKYSPEHGTMHEMSSTQDFAMFLTKLKVTDRLAYYD